jgi:hypothetical protein
LKETKKYPNSACDCFFWAFERLRALGFDHCLLSAMWSLAARRCLPLRAAAHLNFNAPLKSCPSIRPIHSTLKQTGPYQIQTRVVPPQYQRFRNNKIPFYQSKRFWVTTGTGTVLFGGYYVTHLEQVPISGRTRFMDVTPKQEEGNSVSTSLPL